MPNRWVEREQAIMNGIMSLLVNECDALAELRKAQEAGEDTQLAVARLYEMIACKVRPTLKVCADEREQSVNDEANLRNANAALRFAVEATIANQSTAPAEIKTVMDALKAAIPGHVFL